MSTLQQSAWSEGYRQAMSELKPELDRLRAEVGRCRVQCWKLTALEQLREKTRLLLDHYLACYDGNADQLAIDTRALLASTAPKTEDA